MSTPRRSSRPGHRPAGWSGVRRPAPPEPGRPGEQGAAAVEFAIVLPILLLIIFAIIDFGRAYNQRLVMNQAAREGARAEAEGQSSSTQAANVVNGRFTYAITVTTCPANASAASSAKVVLTATYQPITPIAAIANLFGGPVSFTQMTATGVMSCVG